MSYGNAEFLDPWKSAFGGAGVRTYLEKRDSGVVLPVAVLPRADAVGPSISGLLNWMTVAALSTARGMRLNVVDELGVVSPPRSYSGSPVPRNPPPAAYVLGDGELNSALASLSLGIYGRKLPDERDDRNDGFCYLELFGEDKHKQITDSLGPWPRLSEVAGVDPSFLRPASELVPIGVSVRDNALHFQRGGGDGQLSALDLYQYARSAIGMVGRYPALPNRSILLGARVGGPTSVLRQRPLWVDQVLDYDCFPFQGAQDFQREFVCAHASGSASCVTALMRKIWGNLSFSEGKTLEEVFPGTALHNLTEKLLGQHPVTLLVRHKHVCLLEGSHGIDDGTFVRHVGLCDALREIRSKGLLLCCWEPGSGLSTCSECGFYNRPPAHVTRCRVPTAVSDDVRTMAWNGDAYHTVDVRSAITDAGWQNSASTARSQLFVEGARQAAFVRMFDPGFAEGKSDKVLSTWFEANYLVKLRVPYCAWLNRAVTAVDPYSVTIPQSEVNSWYAILVRRDRHFNRDEGATGDEQVRELPPFLVEGRHMYYCPFRDCHEWDDEGMCDNPEVFAKHLFRHGCKLIPGTKCLSVGVLPDAESDVIHNHGVRLREVLGYYEPSRAKVILMSMLETGDGTDLRVATFLYALIGVTVREFNDETDDSLCGSITSVESDSHIVGTRVRRGRSAKASSWWGKLKAAPSRT